jgi:hypothetical protein
VTWFLPSRTRHARLLCKHILLVVSLFCINQSQEEYREDLRLALCEHLCGSELYHAEDDDVSQQYSEDNDDEHNHSSQYSEEFDYDYSSFDHYYEQEEAEEEQEMPDFECQEDIGIWRSGMKY